MKNYIITGRQGLRTKIMNAPEFKGSDVATVSLSLRFRRNNERSYRMRNYAMNYCGGMLFDTDSTSAIIPKKRV